MVYNIIGLLTFALSRCLGQYSTRVADTALKTRENINYLFCTCYIILCLLLFILITGTKTLIQSMM